MNKLAIIPIFFLTMCGTAPITDDPAHAFAVVVEEQHWDHVYRAIEYIKAGQREKTMTDPTDSIDSSKPCVEGCPSVLLLTCHLPNIAVV